MKAFSYVRWSSGGKEIGGYGQSSGDSLRRQIEETEKFCRHKGWDLDDEKMVDVAISGYRGTNVSKGALGEFIRQVDSAEIKTPCILCLEQLDRLTRMRLRDARKLFESLLEKGVKICTVHNGKVYDESSLDNPFDLLMSIMELNQGYEYAASIGRRSGKAWQNKQEQAKTGKIMTTQVPRWLEVKNDKIVEIPERVELVKRIIQDYLKGYGYRTIASRLNELNYPTWGKTKMWNSSYVHLVLSSPALIGEYQPKRLIDGKVKPAGNPITGYYPAIIDHHTFKQIQTRLNSNDKTPGRKTKMNNLFTGLVKCSICNGNMTLMQAHGRLKLVCYAATQGKCKYRTLRYTDFEAGFLHVFKSVILPEMHKAKPVDNALPLRSRIAENERKLEKLNRALLETDDAPKMVLDTMSKLERENDELRKQIDSIAIPATSHVENEFKTLAKNIKDVDFRIRMRNVLGRVIESIVVDGEKKLFHVNPRWTDPRLKDRFNIVFKLSDEPASETKPWIETKLIMHED